MKNCLFVGGPYDGQYKPIKDNVDRITAFSPDALSPSCDSTGVKSPTLKYDYKRIHLPTGDVFLGEDVEEC